MSEGAKAYDSGATGARSNVAARMREVPSINRIGQGGSKTLVKFDGVDERVLIDRKTSVTTFPKSRLQALRQSEALKQNGYTGRWEVPNAAEARRAVKMFKDLGIENIEVIVVPIK